MQRSLVGSEMCIRDRLMPEGVPINVEKDMSVSYTHLTLPTILRV
ncbi:hypothetical protein JMUB7523_26690 [Staphylococcus aureus]